MKLKIHLNSKECFVEWRGKGRKHAEYALLETYTHK